MAERKVNFKSHDGTALVGLFGNASAEKPKGLVVLTHGIPSNKDEGGFYVRLCARLNAIGFDTFRFDFRYMGESTGGSHTLLTLDNVTEDIDSAYLTALNCRPRIEYDGVYAVGISCGGGVLLKWADDFRRADVVKRLVMLCPVLDYVYECTGYVKQDYEKHKAEIARCIAECGYVKDRDTEYGDGFLRSALRFDAVTVAKTCRIPIDVYHGTDDLSVPIELSRRFVSETGDVARIIEMDGIGHGFSCPANAESGEPISENVRNEIKAKAQSFVIDGIVSALVNRK